MKDKKKIHRLLPYPSYDVESMQSWFEEMAMEGWHLEKDGVFMGIVSFERGAKKQVRYRLEASLTSTSMWAENNGEPHEETVELYEIYGWEYVTKCGDFFIYRCEDEGVRELNTDPLVQELALKEVYKRQVSSLFTVFFWLVIYQFVWIRFSFFLTMIQIGTGFFLFGEGLVLWIVFDSIKEITHLNRLRKKLKNGETCLQSKKKKKSYASFKSFSRMCILVLWIFTLFTHGQDFLINKKKEGLSPNYRMPFATMADFVVDEDKEYQEKLPDLNGIESWEDWLAPVNVEYSEHALIELSDGKVLEGGLFIHYHETCNTWLANQLAKEYVQMDKKKKGYEEMVCPDLEMDYVAAYWNELHFPTIVLQKGKKVIHAYFYQTSPSYQLSFEEWAERLAESIK